MNKQCYRKIIWVVDDEGHDDELMLFQRNIHDEFGYSIAFKIILERNVRNTFHIVEKEFSTNTVIFLKTYQEHFTYLVNNLKYLKK